jgi:DNA-binding MarR family transcriptional regulator
LKAWRSLADTYRTIYSRVNSDLRRYGLTPPQYSVLGAIGRSESGGLAMNEIGKKLFVTYADITLIVDNLEKRAYLKRSRGTHDRRIVRVELTRKGRILWRRIRALHRRRVADLMNGLSTNELKELTDFSVKLKENVLKLSGRMGSKGKERGSIKPHQRDRVPTTIGR